MLKVYIKTIDFYQKYLSFDGGLLSFLASFGACKYQISCSEYTKQQVISFGLVKGSFLGVKRILSCF